MSMSISIRIPVAIVSIVAVAVLISSLIIVKMSSDSIIYATKEKLAALQSSRAVALNGYFESIEQDLSVFAKNDYVRSALIDFKKGWAELGSNQTSTLQRLYITDNKVGSKEDLNQALDGSYYSEVHKNYHSWFKHLLRQKVYYDIFLFDADGNLVYTVFKEMDYATNINTGEWKDTGLAQVFRAAEQSLDGKQHFSSFKPYAPSNGLAASFIAQAILNDDGSLAGVIAFQVPIKKINKIMQVATGMGRTGETYLVGEDGIMHSNSRFSKNNLILTTKVNGTIINSALQGKIGVGENVNYRGASVISAYGPVAFKNAKWAVIAEVDKAEAIVSPIRNMLIVIGFAGLIMLVIAGVIGVAILNNILVSLDSAKDS